MDALQIDRLREHLQNFDFTALFIEELGWSYTKEQPFFVSAQSKEWQVTPIAEMSGVVVFLVNGLPNLNTVRLEIHTQLLEIAQENLVIFVNEIQQPTQSLWLWMRRDGKRYFSREHLYLIGQPGDLLLSKLSAMIVDINELDVHEQFPLAQLVERVTTAFDVERVTKQFFGAYAQARLAFIDKISGISNEKDRSWLASVLMYRLMFIWFLQHKHFLDHGNVNYLTDRLAASRKRGVDLFYSEFLQALFFEGFAKPLEQRSSVARSLIGEICFLNGGLFLPHQLELRYGVAIQIPDVAFEQLFTLFRAYSWHLDDTPGGKDDEINPDVLGYIFEKYVNQKAFGAYYTRREMTDYLCERTIHGLILARVNHNANLLSATRREFVHFDDLLRNLDAHLCRELLNNVLPKLKLLDPACGSGAFLIAAMKTLINIYTAIVGRIKFLKDKKLAAQVNEWEAKHKSLDYFIKRRIITDNLFGVEIHEEAVEIAKLRLFLALVSSVQTVEHLEPLPNIDFNIVVGNSLIGLMQVDAEDFKNKSGALALNRSYREIVNDKNRLTKIYRDSVASFNGVDLSQIKHDIEQNQASAQPILNGILSTEMGARGIRFEQAHWDTAKNKMGKPIKRLLKTDDIELLRPFHWGFEFNEVLEAGGFDAIITNPPWEVLKPNAKEFFQEHSELVTKNKMTIKEFEKTQNQLLADATIRNEWLAYSSSFAHQSAWFRAAPQFKFQSAVVNGKKTGSDLNLYKLFTEQCVNLLRDGGECGIVIPSGIYTDLGAKGLRDLLFNQTQITGLFCFENRKQIFEDVDSRFKFVVLTFEKGGATKQFPVAFMRHHLAELAVFPNAASLQLSVELIRQLSPDSHSIMEFKSAIDMQIAQKLLKFPLLGDTIEGTWNLRLTNEFHMTNDSHLFKTEPSTERLPLFEGKMIHQFTHTWGKPKYWLDEEEARADLFGRREDNGEQLAYQNYRLGFRDIARNTDERTMIMTILPPMVFCNNKLPTVRFAHGDHSSMLFVCAVMNSFVIDYLLRFKVTASLNFFLVYPTPIPRLTAADSEFMPIVNRAARLICITPEYDELAKAVGLTSHGDGVTNAIERAQLRAELDGLIAHVYGLTDEEFAHILATFPLVACDIRTAALNAYQTFDNESTT